MRAAPRLSGGQRLLRGSLAAVAAVSTAVVAHSAAGHHAPHPLVVLLALAVSVPLCTALATLRFGRLRLVASVLISQAVFHGLFTFLPASAGAVAPSGAAAAVPHAGHGQAALSAVQGGAPDLGMTFSHGLAAVLTIVVLRRGELILDAFSSLLSLRPARILMTPRAVPLGVGSADLTPSGPIPPLTDLWAGRGPCTVRGPPVPV